LKAEIYDYRGLLSSSAWRVAGLNASRNRLERFHRSRQDERGCFPRERIKVRINPVKILLADGHK